MLNEIIFHSIYRLKQKRNLNLLTKFTFIKKNKVISNFKSIEEEENKEKINLYLKQQEILKNVFSKKEQNEQYSVYSVVHSKEKFIEKDKSLFIEQYIFPRGLKLVSVFNCVMVLSQGINIIPLHQIFWVIIKY